MRGRVMREVRTLRLAAVAMTLPLVLAACAQGGEDVERLARSVDKGVERLVAGPIGPAALSSLAGLPDPPEGMMTVALRTVSFPEPLPGAGIRFYEPTPETEGLFTMDSLEAGEEIPRGDPIEDGIIFVEPGGQARIELVYENPTDGTVQFEATIWYTEPVEAKIGLINRCFCDSVPFTVPANGAWYRTIWVDFSRDMKAGTKMAIVWYVLTDPSEWPLLPGETLEDAAALAAHEAMGHEEEEAEEAPQVEPEVTLEIVGKDIMFDTATLKVEEHTPFKVVFDNQDEAVPHNFHLYRTGPPGTDSIAATEIAQGPAVQELVVEGLDAGTYYFQCDVHPATMSGSLEVG